jgi:hypothetical protein
MQTRNERNNVIVGVVTFVILMGVMVGGWLLWRSKGKSALTEVPVLASRTQTVRSTPAPTSDIPGTLMSFRGRVGESILFNVTGLEGHTIWGTDIYTDDSPLAVAAVHAGALKLGEQGVLRVTILPGQAKYEASSRHGVTSSPYEKWEGSYQLERVTGATTQPVVTLEPPTARAETPGLALGGLERPSAPRRAVGDVYTVEVDGASEGSLWGTDVYTDDSSIALAAVHAGLLAPGERGTLRVTVREGLPAYQGSTRNGITSRPYAQWGGSFTLERIDDPATRPVL